MSKKNQNQNKVNYLKSYKNMLLYRFFEQQATKLYSMKLIRGFCHVYMGQEDVIESVIINTTKDDPLITSYRCHAHALARTNDKSSIMSELMGKETGASKGKGGSMHIFDEKNKFFGGHGIVGAQVSIGTGLAFSEKYNKSGNICVCFFGDGALNQGQTFESINMAALWDLPIVYLLENNLYSMGTKNSRAIANHEKIKERFLAFNIKSFEVQAGEFNSTESVISDAINYSRTNRKPCFVEVKTYRFKGHSLSDPATYRTKDELECYKDKNDPIVNLKNYIISNKISTEKDLLEIESLVENEVNEIVEKAKNSSFPVEASLYEDVVVWFKSL